MRTLYPAKWVNDLQIYVTGNPHPGTILRVWDNGVELKNAGRQADLENWVPVPGEYKCSPTHNLFRLGAPPVGKVMVHTKDNIKEN